MSIQRRLAVSITLVLLFSLIVGSGLTYRHVLSKVRTELQASIAVGSDSAVNALGERPTAIDRSERLRAVVASFDGDRHVRCTLSAPDGRILAQSRLQRPEDPAPSWFYRLVSAPPLIEPVKLPGLYGEIGRLTLEADPHNEVAEAWSDMRLNLIIMLMFFAAVLGLAFYTIKSALAPLRQVDDALLRIGAGDLATRISSGVDYELAPLRDGINAMAERLAATLQQNQRLDEQIINLQEEERAEIARDLHDDVAPFVFAVGMEAAMIKKYLVLNATAEIGSRADAIDEAVRHMQSHLKHVLRRLAPGALLDLGLSGAIDDLIAFWATRRPKVVFDCQVSGEPLDAPLNAVAFRLVQESVSNALRHGNPSTIDIVLHVDHDRATLVIEDDGSGMAADSRFGFGLTGMQQRVRSIGGTVTVSNRSARSGVIVEAVLPLSTATAELERAGATA